MPKPDAKTGPFEATQPSASAESGPGGLLERNPGFAVAYEALLAEMPVEYCDGIARRIGASLHDADSSRLLAAIGHVCRDAHPGAGYLCSTRKILDIVGRNGCRYRIIVERLTP